MLGRAFDEGNGGFVLGKTQRKNALGAEQSRVSNAQSIDLPLRRVMKINVVFCLAFNFFLKRMEKTIFSIWEQERQTSYYFLLLTWLFEFDSLWCLMHHNFHMQKHVREFRILHLLYLYVNFWFFGPVLLHSLFFSQRVINILRPCREEKYISRTVCSCVFDDAKGRN